MRQPLPHQQQHPTNSQHQRRLNAYQWRRLLFSHANPALQNTHANRDERN